MRKSRKQDRNGAATPIGLIIQAALFVMVMGLLFAGWVIKRLADPSSAFRQNVGICILLGAAVFITVLWIRRSNAGERRFAPAAPPTSRFDEPFPRPALEPRACPETQRPSLTQLDWFQFEKLVEVVMLRAGYPVQRSGGAKADGGIDLVIERDGEKVGVQCKHWKAWKPGVRQMREFVGALKDRGLEAGIFIATNEFTADARALAARQNVKLWSEQKLTLLIERTGAWEDPRVQEMLYSGTKQCPKCEREMVLRKPKKARDDSENFWGCSGFPRCRFVLKCT